MTMRMLWTAAVGGLMGLLAGPAAAVVITHNGTVVFSDDFSQAPQVASGTFAAEALLDPPNDADPVADPGTWQILESEPYHVQVTNSTAGDDPGAYTGENYLRMRGEGNRNARADFEAVNSGMLVAEFTTWLAPNAQDRVALGLRFLTPGGTANGHSRVLLLLSPDGNLKVRAMEAESTSFFDTGLFVEGNTWQTWSIELDLDNDVYRVTLDGASTAWLDARELTNTSVGRFEFYQSRSDSWAYIDAIPEPATLSLAGLAAGALLFRRRRAA